jgi:hypothetical protein
MEPVNKPFTIEEYEKDKRERHYKTYKARFNMLHIFRTHNQVTDFQFQKALDLIRDLLKELYGNNNT